MKAAFSFLSFFLGISAVLAANNPSKVQELWALNLPNTGNYQTNPNIKPQYTKYLRVPNTDKAKYIDLDLFASFCTEGECQALTIWFGADLIHCDGKTMEN